jgi:NAD+-dependent secondary alcohol dehydrogenase Adh1
VTVQASEDTVEAVLDATGGGADVVIDFVAETGTELEGPRMLRRAGSYFVVGYGGQVELPTLDIISTEINVVGNLVGTYNELAELMVLQRDGTVTLHTRTYPLDAALDAFADLDGGRIRGRGILVPKAA